MSAEDILALERAVTAFEAGEFQPQLMGPFELFAEGYLTASAELEIVGYRYRPFGPFPRAGAYIQSKKWSFIESPGGMDAHSSQCGAVCEPVFCIRVTDK